MENQSTSYSNRNENSCKRLAQYICSKNRPRSTERSPLNIMKTVPEDWPNIFVVRIDQWSTQNTGKNASVVHAISCLEQVFHEAERKRSVQFGHCFGIMDTGHLYSKVKIFTSRRNSKMTCRKSADVMMTSGGW